jgi:hypothetical protein
VRRGGEGESEEVKFGEGAGVGGGVAGVAAIPRVGWGAEGGEVVFCEEGGELRRGEQYETYSFAHLHKNTLIHGQWKQSAEDERTL